MSCSREGIKFKVVCRTSDVSDPGEPSQYHRFFSIHIGTLSKEPTESDDSLLRGLCDREIRELRDALTEALEIGI
jgi:hypothetical protein